MAPSLWLQRIYAWIYFKWSNWNSKESISPHFNLLLTIIKRDNKLHHITKVKIIENLLLFDGSIGHLHWCKKDIHHRSMVQLHIKGEGNTFWLIHSIVSFKYTQRYVHVSIKISVNLTRTSKSSDTYSIHVVPESQAECGRRGERLQGRARNGQTECKHELFC